MWELDHKESWAPKNWGFWTVLLEKTLESSLDCKEIKLVNPKGNQSWIFTGRTDAEAETLTLWPPDGKNWLSGKDPDAGKDWRREEKGTTGDEMVGWHHWLNGHEFEQAQGVGDGQGSLECWSSWGCKELDTTEWLNWTDRLPWGSYSVLYSFMGFDKCVMSCIHHDSIIKNSFTALKIPGAPSIHLSHPPPWKLFTTADLFIGSVTLPFPECHTVKIV